MTCRLKEVAVRSSMHCFCCISCTANLLSTTSFACKHRDRKPWFCSNPTNLLIAWFQHTLTLYPTHMYAMHIHLYIHLCIVYHLTLTALVCVHPLPATAAAAVALKSPPTVKYRLDFGKAFGSSFTAAPIVAFVNFIIREVIVGMLLWPNRITVRFDTHSMDAYHW